MRKNRNGDATSSLSYASICPPPTEKLPIAVINSSLHVSRQGLFPSNDLIHWSFKFGPRETPTLPNTPTFLSTVLTPRYCGRRWGEYEVTSCQLIHHPCWIWAEQLTTDLSLMVGFRICKKKKRQLIARRPAPGSCCRETRNQEDVEDEEDQPSKIWEDQDRDQEGHEVQQEGEDHFQVMWPSLFSCQWFMRPLKFRISVTIIQIDYDEDDDYY